MRRNEAARVRPRLVRVPRGRRQREIVGDAGVEEEEAGDGERGEERGRAGDLQ
jgi:hypothetical protein